MAMQGLSPQQLYDFQGQRNSYGQDLARNKAGNVYQQQLANMQFGRNQRNYNRMWDQRRTQLPTDYIRRGVGRSGIYQGALQNYATDRLTGMSDMQLNHQMSQAGLVFGDRGFEDEYAQQMAGNYTRQYATQAQIAAALRGAM